MKIETCALCDQEKPLCSSHVIPRFVFDWLKQSSATGYLRTSQMPNRREQDGIKVPMLCHDCEEMFSNWETIVANNIFYPVHKNESNNFEYGPWLLKFAVSITWRVLLHRLQKETTGFSPQAIQSMNATLTLWKGFLLNKEPHPGPYEQHMIFLDVMTTPVNLHDIPQNINRYFLRTVDINVVSGGGTPYFVYAKMCKMVLLGLLKYPYPKHWQGTKIHVKKGTRKSGEIKLPIKFWEYLKNRVAQSDAVTQKLSKNQWAVIETSYNRNKERVDRSETIRAMEEDIRLSKNANLFEIL